MTSLDTIAEKLKDLLESAKDMPTEKIAAVGLIVLGAGAIIKDMAEKGTTDASQKLQELLKKSNTHD